MATDRTVTPSNRPNPVLLIALALAVAAYLAYRMFSVAPAPGPVPSPGPRGAPATANGSHIEPGDLDVRIEDLSKPGARLSDAERNPFRFKPAPPPPLPPPVTSKPEQPVFTAPTPIGPPPPPPISETIKFIGYAETARGKVGAFSVWDPQTRECRGLPVAGREGDVVDGRFRIVQIGIESAVLEDLNGKRRDRLPLNGQACVAK